jgi:PhnB protein
MILGIHPYIVIDGRGKEAIAFYQKAIEAQVLQVQTFADAPENPEFPVPAEAKDLVINAHLKIGDTDLMISDNFPGQPLPLGDQVTIAIIINDVNQSKEIFAKLEEDGQTLMPLQETFWSPLYGQVKDKFGVTWQVSTHIENT